MQHVAIEEGHLQSIRVTLDKIYGCYTIILKLYWIAQIIEKILNKNILSHLNELLMCF